MSRPVSLPVNPSSFGHAIASRSAVARRSSIQAALTRQASAVPVNWPKRAIVFPAYLDQVYQQLARSPVANFDAYDGHGMAAVSGMILPWRAPEFRRGSSSGGGS